MHTHKMRVPNHVINYSFWNTHIKPIAIIKDRNVTNWRAIKTISSAHLMFLDIGWIYCLALKTAINFLMVFSSLLISKVLSDLEISLNLNSHDCRKVKGMLLSWFLQMKIWNAERIRSGVAILYLPQVTPWTWFL